MPFKTSSLANQRERERDFTQQIQQLYQGVHAACFYDDDAVLVEALSEFVRAGLDAGEVAVAILTKPHRTDLDKRLAQNGYDLAALKAAGRYATFDAAETLSLFMRNGHPDETLFKSLVYPLFMSFARIGTGVRGFGEMVTVLWEEGNAVGAAELEMMGTELGREIAKISPLTLLCAYPAALGARKDFAKAKTCVHREHGVVVELAQAS
jgi:hypothetical protein